MLRLSFLSIFTILTCCVFSQRVETVTASYCYEVSDNTSPIEAKYETIRRAQIEAIGKTFGNIVTDESKSYIREKNGESRTDFFSLGECDIKGEWIETIGDTIWETPIHKDNSTIYCVKLEGKIRELTAARIDYEYKVLINGTDPEKNEIRKNAFKDGDNMYLYFKAPIDGYLAVYNVDYDDNMTTQRILPYQEQPGGIYKIKADSLYFFFSEEHESAETKTYVNKLKMRSRTNHDYNQFYIIFSPNSFVKANDSHLEENMPAVLDYGDFQKWLAKNRKHDRRMCVDKLFVDIIKEK